MSKKVVLSSNERELLQPLFAVESFEMMSVECQKLLLQFHQCFLEKGYSLEAADQQSLVYFDKNKMYLKLISSNETNLFTVSYRFERTGYFVVDQSSSFKDFESQVKYIPQKKKLSADIEKQGALICEDVADTFVGRFLFEHPALIESYNAFHEELLKNNFVFRTIGRELQYEQGSFLVTAFVVKKYEDRVLFKHSYSGMKVKGVFSNSDAKYLVSKILESMNKERTASNVEVSKEAELKAVLSVSFDNLEEILQQFKEDYVHLTSSEVYVNEMMLDDLKDKYSQAFEFCNAKENIEEIKKRGELSKLDIELARYFYANYRKLQIEQFEAYNDVYLNNKLIEEKDYLDHILHDIDPVIMLDDDQRKAVVSDDSNCLLIAGAGAGKTTTMAAKVKYLVEKRNVNPDEIVVISYTNMAINELKDRIQEKLKIPCKICTFHSFGYDILKKSDQAPSEIIYSSYNYIYECIKNKIYDNASLLRNIILFFGYYFDIDEDFANFNSLNQYHQYKSDKNYESIKSDLGQYNSQVIDSRTKKNKTITGEYLRSVQEVQIANFLYLNQLDYEYEPVYPHAIQGAKKKY
ncbi:MAG: UvrD-helicase domain-containing protein, partial [Erysipelotrichaceae bacterium]|nr:UvrD-helicase domain-containing protein [Erysipelotrichaceae bacterium]